MAYIKRNINNIIIFTGIITLLLVGSYMIYSHFTYTNELKIEEISIEEYIDDTSNQETVEAVNNEAVEEDNNENNINYWAVLEIPQIGLKRGLCSIGQWCNAVSSNVQVIEKSNTPDVENGVLIIAGHNGTSKVSFFNKLDKLEINDSIFIYYNGIKYDYKLNNSYEIEKNGTATIHRDLNKTTLVLITCKKNSKTKQVVYIAYLDNKTNY